MYRTIAAAIAFIITLLLLAPTSANALSCAIIPSIEEAYNRYDAVIVGHVESRRDSGQLKVKVLESFKGVESSRIKVVEDRTWGNLNGPTEENEDHLFFLMMRDGVWENPLCAPSKKVSEAAEELRYLQPFTIELTEKDDRSPSPIVLLAIGVPLFAAVVILLFLRRRRRR